MKNYKEMADAVFRRRDEYAVALKRKKKIALNASLSLCAVCLATLGAFGIWKTGVLAPDPNVIGTRPQYMTEATDPSKHTLGSNATSEGVYSENTQVISGNSKPQGSSGNSSESSEATSPQGINKATDPVEKPNKPTQSTKPAVNPTLPQIKPSLPDLPTLPVGPNLPILPTLPVVPDLPSKPSQDVPPTSGDAPKPNPPVVLPTDPVEVPDATAATSSGDVGTEDDVPPQPATPEFTWAPSASPDSTAGSDEIEGPGWPGVPDETATEPCWTVATEPATEAPAASDPCEEPTEAPETQSPTAKISVYGKVVDQNGSVVKGAEVTLYRNGTAISTVKTNSNGDYTFASVEYSSDLYVKQTYAPSGYTSATNRVYVNSPNDYGSNYIVLICTKN